MRYLHYQIGRRNRNTQLFVIFFSTVKSIKLLLPVSQEKIWLDTKISSTVYYILVYINSSMKNKNEKREK